MVLSPLLYLSPAGNVLIFIKNMPYPYQSEYNLFRRKCRQIFSYTNRFDRITDSQINRAFGLWFNRLRNPYRATKYDWPKPTEYGEISVVEALMLVYDGPFQEDDGYVDDSS